jgi:perosamine synthetase
VDRFEREVADYLGVPHAVATVNGSAALHVALLAAGVRAGDEVLLPTFTFISTANAVAYCGAIPVFGDSEPVSWGLDPAKTEDFLARQCDVRAGQVVNRATGRVIRALLPVHLYGHPCDLDPFLELARRYPLPLVEDSAEALGARYRDRAVGCEGLAGCLSFNGNKIITAGGGMVSRGTRGWLRGYAPSPPGPRRPRVRARRGRLQLSHRNLQAALRVAQLGNSTSSLGASEHGGLLPGRAGRRGGVTVFAEAPWARSTYWMASLLVNERRAPDLRALLRDLNADGIQARPLWRPLHQQPVFGGAQAYRIEVADRLYARGLSLPCSVGITPEERERVVAALTEKLV